MLDTGLFHVTVNCYCIHGPMHSLAHCSALL